MYIDPDGKSCWIVLKGNGMALVEYSNGYLWVFKCLVKHPERAKG